MTTSAAAFMRASNLIVMDYPYAAAVASALRLCDELCVVVGQSVDATRDAIYALQHEYGADSIKIKEEVWTFDRGWQERWWDSCRDQSRVAFCPGRGRDDPRGLRGCGAGVHGRA